MGQPERGSCDLAMVSCFLHPFLIKKYYSCIEMFDGSFSVIQWTLPLEYVAAWLAKTVAHVNTSMYCKWQMLGIASISFQSSVFVWTSVFQVCMSKATEKMECKAHI